MNILEFEKEELARTVKCPICGRRPGLRCRYKGLGLIECSEYSHWGRLKVARGERL